MQTISGFVPLTYMLNLLRALWVGHPRGGNLLDVGVLDGMLLCGVSLL